MPSSQRAFGSRRKSYASPSGETAQERARAGTNRRSRVDARRGAGRAFPRRAARAPRWSRSGSSVAGSPIRCRESVSRAETTPATMASRSPQSRRAAASAASRQSEPLHGMARNRIASRRGERRLRHRDRRRRTGSRSTTRSGPTSQKNARTDEERQKLPEMLSLWPFTGRVDRARHGQPRHRARPRLVREDRRPSRGEVVGRPLHVRRATRSPLFLAEFWKAIARFHRFVTFNGRSLRRPVPDAAQRGARHPVSRRTSSVTGTPSSPTPTCST